MSDTDKLKEFKIQRGNDLYTLDVTKRADGTFWGMISLFSDFEPSGRLAAATPIKECAGNSIEELETTFTKLVDQMAPEED